MGKSEPSTTTVRYAAEPLISRCTSAWRAEETGSTDVLQREEQSQYPANLEELVYRTGALLRTPKVQRLLLATVLAAGLAVLCWKNFLSPIVQEHATVWRSLQSQPGQSSGNLFGVNQRVQLEGLTQLGTLNTYHLPRASRSDITKDRRKRLIFIGDIHGCMNELEALLKKAQYNPAHDHIICTGDMINKGPRSNDVIRFLMLHRASCVRGNHEDRILLMSKSKHWHSTSEEDQEAIGEKDARERALAASLGSDELNWLASCPVILDVGRLAKMRNTVVVHAGLVPRIALLDQDPTAVMNMRIIDLANRMPSKKHNQEGAIPWYKFWNKYQRLLPIAQFINSDTQAGRMTVVYGHDSKRGLQLHQWTKGLDSGCVNGGHLTALVVGDLGHQQVVQVSCSDK